MTTADDVLNEARRWLGTAEQPAGSNNVLGVTDRFGVRAAWCDMWVSTVLENAGIDLPGIGFTWVSSHFEWAKHEPGWTVFTDWRDAQPGDLVGWEWGQTLGGLDHISIVEANGPFTTLGGNERDAVRRQVFAGRPNGAVIFARPPYMTPAPISEDDDMQPLSFLVFDPDGSGWWECFSGCPDRRHVNMPFGPDAELNPLKFMVTAAGGQVLDENTDPDQRRFWMYARNPVVTGSVDPKVIADQVVAAIGQANAGAVVDELRRRLEA